MSNNELILSGGEQFFLSISPDWPMIIITGLIGIGSILTSIIVGRISKQNQKIQNVAKKAELRQIWLDDLRNTLSEYMSVAATISVRRQLDKAFMSKETYYEYHMSLLKNRTKVNLMLDPSKEYAAAISSLLDDVYLSSVDKESSIDDLNSYRIALEEQSQQLLEKAWGDIKNELQ
ncbi:hypothetical protein AAFX20_12135 [Vibrio chagasii]|uniref:hypothetical protein n=1 Tax=Vibrio chagasii TaxID=170679 RepID=UPI0038CD7057